MSLTRYQAKYFAYELTKRCPADSIEKLAGALSDAQVDLNPHQIEAALFAFRSPLSKGAVLADEVGLGKTIEAGLLLAQKWAEGKRRLLVICPSNLRKQWSQELADKFFLPSDILETRSFNDAVRRGNLNPFDTSNTDQKIVICSYQFVRSKDPYVRQTTWDLVVIDEAHRLRNVYKAGNKIAQAIKDAIAPAKKILLTATPLQNSLLELFGLISIIDEFVFGDLKSFRTQYARLGEDGDYAELKRRVAPICKRTLRKQVLEYVPYTNRHALVQEFIPSDDEQKLYDLVSAYLQRPSLYALPASQRQLMTLILRKLLASSTYAISSTLGGLARKLDDAIRKAETVQAPPDEVAEDFEELSELEDEWEEDEDREGQSQRPDALTSTQIAEMREETHRLKEFHALAQNIVKNSKGEVLLTALRRGFAAAADAKRKTSNPATQERTLQQKALIFTESRRTQDYLLQILEETEFAGKIVLFNGSNTDAKSKEIYQDWLARHAGTDKVTNSPTADKRAALVDYFRDEASIMIATEAAAEGINLQFCNVVVNYDLPWNPQRIEQRIGRCHRYGQKYDVVVVNFLNRSNAADQRVYELLDKKFRLFDGVFGASDEVLGAVESGVDFERRIAEIYQKCRTPQQIAFEFDALQSELGVEIDDKRRDAREQLLNNFDQEVIEKVRIESGAMLNRFQEQLWKLTRFMLDGQASFEDHEHRFTLHKNPFAPEPIHPGPYRMGKSIDDANVYRPGHPLAQRVLELGKTLETPYAELTFDYAAGGRKVASLEGLIGSSGHLAVERMTFEALDHVEDHLVFAGLTDQGLSLDSQQAQRLLSLPSVVTSQIPLDAPASLARLLDESHVRCVQDAENRNQGFFETECRKLDAWADDQMSQAEKALKDAKTQVRELRNEIAKATVLADRLRLQEDMAACERRQRKLRQEIFDVEDRIAAERERLVAEVRAKLNQREFVEHLFTIRWVLPAPANDEKRKNK
jgi:superfamily II DNA or RNA helicase